MQYAELQVTTNFSFLRGGSHPEEFVREAAALDYHAIAITDRNSVAGVVRAHTAAKEKGIPFVVGCHVTLFDAHFFETRTSASYSRPELESRAVESSFTELHRVKEFSSSLRETRLGQARRGPCNAMVQNPFPLSLLLYPTSKTAYGNLCKLLTLGKSRAPKGECYLSLGDVAKHHAGLLAVAVIHTHKDRSLRSHLQAAREIFSEEDRLSVALSMSYLGDAPKHQHQTVTLASELGIPLVATNDVHYHSPSRRKLQDVITCIRHGCTIDEAGFKLHANGERCLKSPGEMSRLFEQYPEATLRTVQISERALAFSLDQLRYEYPHEICPTGKEPQQYLEELTWIGAKDRYPNGVPEKVSKQLNHELALIQDLDYAKYFLTVYDIVQFARSRAILCQGRGAAANSSVCYCLGITAVNPDEINLLFERFVSRERNEPPDIDIDFEHERREEVVQYIYNKYGRERAALVAEVICYRTKSAVREVGKVFGLPLETIESLSRLIRHTDGPIEAEALERIGLTPRDPRVVDLFELISTLRSFPRHLSQHVGGFVISEPPLSEIVPIENTAMIDRTVIEWDKDDIEQMGMLKVDILGLGMLTAIRKALEFVNEGKSLNHRVSQGFTELSPLQLHNIPPDDPDVYDMICNADTIGVFQIESRAQMSMLPRLRPRCFYDLVIEVAIVRPGPIVGGMVHPYLRRRTGEEKVEYPDERIKEILHSTLGVPIFQEQVMQLVMVAAGFTPGEADNLRRAMASWKRSKDLYGKFGAKITEGMLRNGYDRSFAEQIILQISGFGEYGFPQSHAASFALLVYVSAWLKHYHPAAFAAALINSQPMGFYQPSQLIQDAQRHGVTALGIDINQSGWDCTLEEDAAKTPALRLGMRLVKSLQESEAEKIISAVRTHGPYTSLVTLWRESGVRVHTLAQLARADAFQSMKMNRQEALWQIRRFRDEPLPLFESHANGVQQKTDRELNGEIEPIVTLPPFSPVREVLKDYEITGHSLKTHPLAFLRTFLSSRGVTTAEDYKDPERCRSGETITLCGIVLVRQRPGTANGVIFITLEDETGLANLIIRPEITKRFQGVFHDSTLLLAHGEVQRKDNVIHLMVRYGEDVSYLLSELGSCSRDFH